MNVVVTCSDSIILTNRTMSLFVALWHQYFAAGKFVYPNEKSLRLRDYQNDVKYSISRQATKQDT